MALIDISTGGVIFFTRIGADRAIRLLQLQFTGSSRSATPVADMGRCIECRILLDWNWFPNR